MRKKLICWFALMAITGVGIAQQAFRYRVTGTIEGIDSGWVWMKQKRGEGWQVLDSARIDQGKFCFQGKEKQGIQSVNLSFNKERGTLVVFLEPGEIRVSAQKDSIYYAYVTGTRNNERWGNYVRGDRWMQKIEEQASKAYQQSFETKDRNQVKAAERKFSEVIAGRKCLKANFLSAPENRYVAACWYRSSMIHRMQFQEIDSIIRSFGRGMEGNNDYRQMLARRELVKKQVVGQAFGEIRLADPDGEERSLSALKGKWVLVDFWASWCGPCRREGKHVLELYEKYHSEGFEVFGVSIDQHTDAWKKAIREDGTSWIHVCDQEGRIAKEYGITIIPHLFLLNPEGKIEAINIPDEQLTQKLEKIYGK